MPKSRKSLADPRLTAFSRQSGCCYYCNQPMCTGNIQEFSQQYKLTKGQARLLLCTGEHLKAFKDGGSSGLNNIVAACWYCNQGRHKRKKPKAPGQYKEFISHRISQGRWHGIQLH